MDWLVMDGMMEWRKERRKMQGRRKTNTDSLLDGWMEWWKERRKMRGWIGCLMDGWMDGIDGGKEKDARRRDGRAA